MDSKVPRFQSAYALIPDIHDYCCDCRVKEVFFLIVTHTNFDLSKQSYTFSVTCLHIYPGWYQQNISKIIRTYAPGGLMPDFYC